MSKFGNNYLRKFRPSVFDSGIIARLPDAYKKFYNEWKSTPEPVHYIPHRGNPWYIHEKTGEVKRVACIPLPLRFPRELNDVFTGGEAIVQGFKKKTKYSNRNPHFWVPQVYRSVIYSEILDKYLSVLLTKRVVDLIHKHQGLDTYLLATKACDLKSTIALKLKRCLLTALNNRDFPYDDEKNEQIYNKYEKYLIPPEEIEWYGLNITEARQKLEKIEEAEKKAAIVPLKHIYRAQLIEELKSKPQPEGVVPVLKKRNLKELFKIPGKQ